MSLKDDIFNFRVKNNISQAELADRCKCSKMTINQIEGGKLTPSRFTEQKIRLVIGEGNGTET